MAPRGTGPKFAQTGWRNGLRIALLSMMEPADGGLPLRRAFLRVGGKTLAHHQLDLAIASDCERVICLSAGMDPDLIALQHATEKAGRHFRVASGPRELVGIITSGDEVVVFADGLFAPAAQAAALIERGPAVLVQPVETGVKQGFERLDLNHASAGLLRIPGRHVEALSEMPADCDVASALTRIALQRGVEMRDIQAASAGGAPWRMITGETEAYAAEGEWLSSRLASTERHTPGLRLAYAGVLNFGASLLHSGNAGKAAAVSAMLVMALALGSAWLGSIVAGLVLCGIGWIIIRGAFLLRRLESARESDERVTSKHLKTLEWVLDLAIIVILAWGTQAGTDQSFGVTIFPPLILLLLVRLVPGFNAGPAAAWVWDRSVLVLVLALAAVVGLLPEAIRVIAVLLAVAGVAFTAEKRG